MKQKIQKLDWIYIFLSLVFIAASIYWLYLNDFTTAHVDDTLYQIKSYYLANYSQLGFAELIKGLLFIRSDKPPLLTYFYATLITVLPWLKHKVILTIGILSMIIAFVFNLFYFFKVVFKNNQIARNYLLLIFMLSPLLFGVAKLAMVEMMLLNFIILTWTLIYKWKGALDKRRAIWLGLVCALGAYSKSTYLIYMFLPLFHLFFPEQINKFLDKLGLSFKKTSWFSGFVTKVKKLLIGSDHARKNLKWFVLGFAICLPWYLINSIQVFSRFFSAANFERHTDGPFYSPLVLLNYIFDLIMAFGFFSVLLLGYLIYKYREDLKSLFKEKFFFMISFGPLLLSFLLLFVNNKNERFQFISFFVIALVLALMIEKVKLSNWVILIFVLQAVLSTHIGFYNFLPFVQTRVLYATRPYPEFFDPRLRESLSQYFKTTGMFYKVHPQLTERDINVEFQTNTKNPRSIDEHLRLIEAQAGYLPADLVFKDHRKNKARIKNGKKEIIDENPEYMLRVIPKDKEISPLIRSYRYLEPIGDYFSGGFRYLLYKKAFLE